MATVTKGRTFTSGETVTPAKLNDVVDLATVTNIVDADIGSGAAIAASKLAGTLDLSSKTVTLPDDSVTNAKLSLAANDGEIKKALNANNSPPIFACRAWVNFDGVTADNLTGTYSQSGTTVTVTATAHGHKVGHQIYADVTSGTGVDGTYTVATVPDANSFTYTAGTSLTTSGNITLRRRSIRGSGNVQSVAYNGVGDYTINFTTAMPDANYCVTTGWTSQGGALTASYDGSASIYSAATVTASSVRVYASLGPTAGGEEAEYYAVAVFA
jgi:hypothetical protein